MRNKLAQLMESKGYNVSTLAKRIGISRGYLSQILNGQRALAYERAVEYLIKGFNYKPSDAEKEIQKWRLEEYGFLEVENSDVVKIPVLGSVSCGALKDPDIADYEEVSNAYIKGNAKDYFILKANGVSMHGHIEHGDHVLVRRTQNNVGNNIMIFRVGTEFGSGFLQVKEGILNIIKSNKDWPPILLEDESTDFQIIGVVEAVVYRKLSR